jgi:microcin C transport system ATP-binding protein
MPATISNRFGGAEVRPILDVRNLTVRFGGTEAVSGVTFTVGKGETVALVGESGSGKSVTALSTVSLLPETAELGGSITYDGAEMLGASEGDLRQVRGNDISFIFQEPMTSLNPLHTLEKQIAESLALHQGLVGQAARERILELLTPRRHPRSRKPAGRLSPPVVGRAAAARDDRHGAREQPQAPDRR